MERPDSYEALAALAGGYLRRGVCANTMVTEERYGSAVREGRLAVWAEAGNLLLLTRFGAHDRLTFLLNDLTAPLPDDLPRPVVAEIAYRPRDTRLREAAAYLSGQGFAPLLERVRLSRPAAPAEADTAGLSVPGGEEAEAVGRFLAENFSALTGCLPTGEELAAQLGAGRFLLARDGGGIAGLIHFAPESGAVEIRHLAVREDRRGRGLGKKLVGGALAVCGGVRAQVWVRDGYEAALGAYAAWGFTPDGRRSAVLCRE